MPSDTYGAIWVSHSSISDFLECPRAYYLKNMYKNPKTGNKMQIMSPPLALGQAIHEVIESLSVLSTDRRFDTPLTEKFEDAWKKITGKKGGFHNESAETHYKHRGEAMILRVTKNPGPLTELAVKIQMNLPHYWLSEEDNILLCGKIDWLQYNEETKGVHIIDFKTSKHEEQNESLQLPIYHLLAHNCQKFTVEKASYWYLESKDSPTSKKLPDLEASHKDVLKIAKKIKLARQLNSFQCPLGDGCRACKPFEQILQGKGELVGNSEFGHDIYVLPEYIPNEKPEGTIL